MEFDVAIFHVQIFNVVAFFDEIIFQILVMEFAEEKMEQINLERYTNQENFEPFQNYLRRLYTHFLFSWLNLHFRLLN